MSGDEMEGLPRMVRDGLAPLPFERPPLTLDDFKRFWFIGASE